MVLNSRIKDVDLAIVGRSSTDVVREQIIYSSLFLTSVFAAVAVAFSTGLTIDPIFLLAVLIMSTCLSVYVPQKRLRSLAHRRREEFSLAFSAFLGLVNVMLAGGAGIETALLAASRAGDDWVFIELEQLLLTARSTRQSPWVLLNDLGARYAITDVTEVASSLQLAGEQGSRIRSSLSTKAATLRMRQLAHAEAQAQSATEQMGIPTVLLFIGFIVLLGYPALNSVSGNW